MFHAEVDELKYQHTDGVGITWNKCCIKIKVTIDTAPTGIYTQNIIVYDGRDDEMAARIRKDLFIK